MDTVVRRHFAMQAAPAETRPALSRSLLKNHGVCLSTCCSSAYAEYTLFPIKSIEHAIGGMKRYNILVQVFRNRKADFEEDAVGICAGLWNFALSYGFLHRWLDSSYWSCQESP